MNSLERIVEADKRCRCGELTMQVHISYSLAAELAKKADALAGWEVVEFDEGYRITSPSGDEASVWKKVYSDDHPDTELLRQLAQAMLGAS